MGKRQKGRAKERAGERESERLLERLGKFWESREREIEKGRAWGTRKTICSLRYDFI